MSREANLGVSTFPLNLQLYVQRSNKCYSVFKYCYLLVVETNKSQHVVNFPPQFKFSPTPPQLPPVNRADMKGNILQ